MTPRKGTNWMIQVFQCPVALAIPAAYRPWGGHETVDFVRHLALPLIATHSVEFNANC